MNHNTPIPCVFQEGSENEEEEREEEEEENTDYLTDSNKENETDDESNVRCGVYLSVAWVCLCVCCVPNRPVLTHGRR